MRNLPATLLLIGLGLLLLSLLAPLLFGERRTWTNAVAQQYQKASQQYHAALHAHLHTKLHTRHESGGELSAAKQAFEQFQSQLDRSAARGQRIARTLRWLGMIGCGLGLVLHFWTRLADSGN